jgi:hypothetical protein
MTQPPAGVAEKPIEALPRGEPSPVLLVNPAADRPSVPAPPPHPPAVVPGPTVGAAGWGWLPDNFHSGERFGLKFARLGEQARATLYLVRGGPAPPPFDAERWLARETELVGLLESAEQRQADAGERARRHRDQLATIAAVRSTLLAEDATLAADIRNAMTAGGDYDTPYRRRLEVATLNAQQGELLATAKSLLEVAEADLVKANGEAKEARQALDAHRVARQRQEALAALLVAVAGPLSILARLDQR